MTARKVPSAGTIAATIVGLRTARGATIERATVTAEGMVLVTFAGSGPAPFRQATYTPRQAWSLPRWADDAY